MNLVERVVRIGAWAEIELAPGMLHEAMKRLTLTVKDKEIQLPQYRRHPDTSLRLFVPRAIVAKYGLPVADYKWEKMNVGSKLIDHRPGQKETISEFMTALNNGSPYGGILQAVTGAGKSAMGLDLACKLGFRTMIVVPRQSLMQQWVDNVKKWTTASDDDIGIVRGPKRDFRDKKFVVAMIHTLAQQLETFPRDFYTMFGTVIWDEVHTVGAETFSKTAAMFASKYRIGLSATPRRQDGMDSVFYWHIGPIVAKFTQLQAKARVRVINYRGPDTDHNGCVWGGKLNLGRYLNRVARSKPRLQLVANIVKRLDEKEHDILVLSERIGHLHGIQALLLAAGVPKEKIGFLIGKQKDYHGRKIILGTYGSAGMGVDIPRLTALVLATPRADIEQAVGRVLRQGNPIVVDICDVASSIMLGWYHSRMKYYKKITDNIQVQA